MQICSLRYQRQVAASQRPAVHHPLGKVVVVVASSVAIYWGLGYRHLDE
jgi:hypothetical protein